MVQSVPGVDHVADYRLAVQMWLPRDTNHNNRWVPAGAKLHRQGTHPSRTAQASASNRQPWQWHPTWLFVLLLPPRVAVLVSQGAA